MKLILTPVEIVDLKGKIARMDNEVANGVDLHRKDFLANFKDLGRVEFEGSDYYASLYQPPDHETEIDITEHD